MTDYSKDVLIMLCSNANKQDWFVYSADLEIIGEKEKCAITELKNARFIEKVNYIGQHYIQCQITEKGIEYYVSLEH